MLKRLLDSLDGVDDSIKKLYEEKDGKFHLKLEGSDELDSLKRKKDIEAEHRRKAETKLADLQTRFEEVESEFNKIKDEKESESYDKNKNKGDIDALENSWKLKLEKQKGDYEAQIESLRNGLNSLLVDNNAQKMASDLAVEGSSDALIPHIRQRLGVDVRDGKHVAVVLDADGKPSALTLDELKTEIGSNKALAPLISGSKANGGGASNPGGGTSGKKFSELSEQERSALYRADPAKYRAARDTQ